MDVQIAHSVRGKAIEILIVGAVSYVTFALFGLNYAALLALLGLSMLDVFTVQAPGGLQGGPPVGIGPGGQHDLGC